MYFLSVFELGNYIVNGSALYERFLVVIFFLIMKANHKLSHLKLSCNTQIERYLGSSHLLHDVNVLKFSVMMILSETLSSGYYLVNWLFEFVIHGFRSDILGQWSLLDIKMKKIFKNMKCI